MNEIDIFTNFHGQGDVYDSIDQSVIDRYSGILPDFLLKIWDTRGLVEFSDGFWKLTNPNDFEKTASCFFKQSNNKIIVMRTALGGLFYLDIDKNVGKNYYFFCPVLYKNIKLGDDHLEDVFNSWLTTDFLYEPLMLIKLYQEARKNLAKPKKDDCYGFVPAIALGGDMYPENLKVMNVYQHLEYLSQLG